MVENKWMWVHNSCPANSGWGLKNCGFDKWLTFEAKDDREWMRTDAVWANTRCAMLWYLCLMDKPLGCTWIGQYIYAHEIFVKSNLKLAQEKQTDKQCSWRRRRPLKYQRIQTEHFLQRLQGKGFSPELKRMLLAIKLPELLQINAGNWTQPFSNFRFSKTMHLLQQNWINQWWTRQSLTRNADKLSFAKRNAASHGFLKCRTLRIRPPPILVKGQ